MYLEHLSDLSDGVILVLLSRLGFDFSLKLGQKWRSKKRKAQIIPSLEFSSYIVCNVGYKFLAFDVLSITLSILFLKINIYIR